jgi:hypothetical protein
MYQVSRTVLFCANTCLDAQWIYAPVSGKSPTKRYQHSAYYDANKQFMYIYGGINRMTSLRDLNILSLRSDEGKYLSHYFGNRIDETMQWIKPKLLFDVDIESKAHDYSLFVGGKVIILDLEKMNSEKKLDYLKFSGKFRKNKKNFGREHPDLNRGPTGLQPAALPLSYTPLYIRFCHKPPE